MNEPSGNAERLNKEKLLDHIDQLIRDVDGYGAKHHLRILYKQIKNGEFDRGNEQ